MSYNHEERHMIEALRSGIPSRAIGRHFSEARGELLDQIVHRLDQVASEGKSDGMIITGKYGEGKTHLVNTVYTLAHARNMVVSTVSLSKETPFDKLHFVYPKLVAETYLPGKAQPGFITELDNKLTEHAPLTTELLLYTARKLETDKLYYLLKCFVKTEDLEERFQFQTDLEGDFISNVLIKQIYRRIYEEKVVFNQNFAKTRHSFDYYTFLSHLFRRLGYSGWVILFDESELIGRLGKKARLKAYQNMARFLFPPKSLEGVFTLFAFSASYSEDVIEAKGEYQNLEEVFPDDEQAKAVLDAIIEAEQLAPLTREEIEAILSKIIAFHAKAYNWDPAVDQSLLLQKVDKSGYLLRSKIRSIIEYLDQLYLYGSETESTVAALDEGSYGEVPSYEELFSEEG
jgi:hypothetical protein